MANKFTQTGATRNEPAKPTIVSVSLLDENGNNISGNLTLYVNLDRDQRHVDENTVKHLHQLGRKIRCKVKFNQPGEHQFKIKMIPDGGNLLYSEAEKDRNDNFNFEEEEFTRTTDANGEKIVEDFFVNCCGGNRFKIQARTEATAEKKEKKVTSSKIEVKRLMYYIEARMEGMRTNIKTQDFENTYTKYGIILKKLPSFAISRRGNIGQKEEDPFLAEVGAAYRASTGPAKDPYCIVVAYTEHLAVKGVNKPKVKVKVKKKSPKVKVSLEKKADNKNNRLWYKVAGNDDTNSWFIACWFKRTGSVESVSIDAAQCTAKPPGKVEVDLSTIFSATDADNTSITGELLLRVVHIERMRGGFADSNRSNITTACTRYEWSDYQEQNKVMVHEAGHQFKMVVDNAVDASLPDKPANHYTERGHNGNHCHTGLSIKTTYVDGDATSAGCVMFGAVGNKIEFCSDCAVAVRKLDLSGGV